MNELLYGAIASVKTGNTKALLLILGVAWHCILYPREYYCVMGEVHVRNWFSAPKELSRHLKDDHHYSQSEINDMFLDARADKETQLGVVVVDDGAVLCLESDGGVIPLWQVVLFPISDLLERYVAPNVKR